MGVGCSYHPYECSHDRYCEHCTLAETDWHNPSECGLCDWLPSDHPDSGKLHKMVGEPFAIKVRVIDLSHRYQKILVKPVTQERIPF